MPRTRIWSIEVGEKARFADRRFTVNADVYYIKWNNIQQLIELTCGYPYDTNAGNARSYGPELEMAAQVTDATHAGCKRGLQHGGRSTAEDCRHRLWNNARNTRSQHAEVHGQRGSELPRADHGPIERLF